LFLRLPLMKFLYLQVDKGPTYQQSMLFGILVAIHYIIMIMTVQDVQLSQKDCTAGCVIVLAKIWRLELWDNILGTL